VCVLGLKKEEKKKEKIFVQNWFTTTQLKTDPSTLCKLDFWWDNMAAKILLGELKLF
jgi:hypothetical protein